MSDWQIVKDFWWLAAGIAGVWTRLEVAQALNRQNIRALWARRREDYAALEKKLDQIHADNNLMRRELREDMKAIHQSLERRS